MTAERANSERVVGIKPGLAVQVAYVGPRRAPAFNSSVERVAAAGVALSLARLPSSQLPPQPGEQVLIVARRMDRMVAFDARVLGIEWHPPLLVVSQPEEARRPERRDGTRVATTVPLRAGVWLHPQDGPQPIDAASLLDVSAGGAQLRALRLVPVGVVVRLEFALSSGEAPVEVQGMVVAVSRGGRGMAPRVHVQFLEMSEDARRQLERHVERSQVRQPKAS